MRSLPKLLAGTTHLLHSIPPGPEGDPVLAQYRDEIAGLPSLEWIGYLSTVGVYGDQEGGWVDESDGAQAQQRAHGCAGRSRAAPGSQFGRGDRRPGAGVPACRDLRPGTERVRQAASDGTARRIKKDGQVFSRIHVEDIASVLEASIARPRAGAIYNVADDEPAAPGEVVAYAAELMGVAPPPEVAFAEADLTPMARSFYEGSRRISNARIKSELGVKLRYPTYREGLAALLADDALGGRGRARSRRDCILAMTSCFDALTRNRRWCSSRSRR